MDAERDKIAAAQFAVDGEIEQREISGAMIQLQSNRMAQISFSFSGGFCPRSLPLFHGIARPPDFVSVSMNNSFVG